MFSKKITIVAGFVLGSASAAFAQSSGEELQNSQYLRNPNAPVPFFAQSVPATLIEGRNVAVRSGQQVDADQPVFDSQKSFGGY